MRIPGSLLLLLTISTLCHAELGGKATPIAAGLAGATVMRQSGSAAGYTVQESQTEDGTTIREFILPSGDVFAVAWSGPRMPNLQNLLGAYFESYRNEATNLPPGRRPLAIDRPDLVVQSGGHPRAFHGRAYLPKQLPAGISTSDIR